MCGIAGYFANFVTSGQSYDGLLERMANAIAHRGPNDGGFWRDDVVGFGLSHRRLSIVDLSSAGHQPMVSPSGRFVLSFNGEIYNHARMRDVLEKTARMASPNRSAGSGYAGLSWRGHSDTETLLRAFESWGVEKTLKRSVGMFAIALWDRAERCLYLMRDRMGEKPLYYGWAGTTLVFGSELKALRPHPGWQGEIDRDALTLFFRHNCIPAPYSIYKNVWKLLPGTYVTISLDDVRQHRLPVPNTYWSILHEGEQGRAAPFNGSDAEALVELEHLSADAIALQQLADVPLGAFLSGGVDSSAVVALMQAQQIRPVRTFTIGFSEAEFNEAGHASAVARHLGTEHTELYVAPAEAQAVIPRLPSTYDEPFADSSQIPTFLVSQMARQHVTVSLSGDGGDELFGGYNRYLVAHNIRWLPSGFRRAMAACARVLPPQVLNTLLLQLSRLNVNQPSDKAYKAIEALAMDSDTDLYRRLVSHWHDPASLVIGGREPPTVLDEMLGRRESGESFEQWMMTTDMQTYLPDDILTKLDRAGMAVGLETRVPFLDHRLVEFSLSLPLHLKIRNGQGKWLLRQMLYKFVPKVLIERPKMGFGVPINSWLRGPLREWAEELLDESRLRREGFLNPKPIRNKWHEHMSGERDWQYYLWDVLMFQAWLEAER